MNTLTEATNESEKESSKKSRSSSLERMKKQKAVIEARIQAAEARLKTSHRKQDTRRKILVGSYYLDQAHKNNTMDHIQEIMAAYLKRNSDRKLFDLPEGAEKIEQLKKVEKQKKSNEGSS